MVRLNGLMVLGHGRILIMFSYNKRLQYPVDIKKKDLRMAKYLVTQYGGANGELAAALRYLNQRFTMPDERGKALLTDIGTEELAHVEMISTMIYQLMKDATLAEIKEAGLDTHYAEHAYALYPTDANGVPFTVGYFASTGDPLADLSEDMAAEQKARATYEWLINLTDDEEIKEILRFLRQREIVHFQRFGEALMDVQDNFSTVPGKIYHEECLVTPHPNKVYYDSYSIR